MIDERWDTERHIVKKESPTVFEEMQDFMVPQFIEVEDTGTAGDLHTLRHGLGRVPRGVRIVNIVADAGVVTLPTAIGWYRELQDENWNDREINLRFSDDNLRTLLEVF